MRRARGPLRLLLLTLALLPLLLLGGCVTSFSLRTDSLERPSVQPTVGPGTSLHQGASVSVQASNSLGALILGAGVVAAISGAWREAAQGGQGEQGEQGGQGGQGGQGSAARRDPEADPSRLIEERDCTRPLEGLRGNLRCR